MPKHCICPDESYTCHVSLVGELEWITDSTELEYSVFDPINENFIYTDSFRVNVSIAHGDILGNITSTLSVTDLSVNGTELTCQGVERRMGIKTAINESIKICVIGM